MIVSFEGLDGVGKTTLVAAVAAALERAPASPPVTIMAEFSDGPAGMRLLQRLAADKFLRPTPFTVTNILMLVDDLAEDLQFSLSLAHKRLAERGKQGCGIVLSDRYRDSIASCEGAMLELAGLSRLEAHVALTSRLEPVPLPELTILVTTDEGQRLERLRSRADHPDDASITDRDAKFFDLVGSWLAAIEGAGRVRVVQNPNGLLSAVAENISGEVLRLYEQTSS